MRAWTWAVDYGDGSIHFEADLGGFSNVDVARVARMVVFDADDPATQYVIPTPGNTRPIFFRRTRKVTITDPNHVPSYYVNPDGSYKTQVVYAVCVGWQKTLNGRNAKSLTWLMHDGSAILTDCDLDELT